METDNFITENFPQNGRKLESVENKIRDIFIQCLVQGPRSNFEIWGEGGGHKTFSNIEHIGGHVPTRSPTLLLRGLWCSAPRPLSSKSSYPTRVRVRGIVVK